MTDIKEYKKISLEFRRISSNFLRTEFNNQSIPLQRFKKYIDSEPVIKNIIESKIKNIDYDFRECFEDSDRGRLNIPIEEDKHIKAMYDYLCYIAENNVSLYYLSMGFPCGSKKATDSLQNFIRIAFKPLIDFITDELAKIMVMIEEENMAINMSNNQGVINYAENGSTIKSDNTINQNDLDHMSKLIESIKNELISSGLNEEDRDNILDDVEIVQEQLQCSIEKPTRFKKAINSIKNFLTNATSLTGISIALGNNLNQLVAMAHPYIDKLS